MGHLNNWFKCVSMRPHKDQISKRDLRSAIHYSDGDTSK